MFLKQHSKCFKLNVNNIFPGCLPHGDARWWRIWQSRCRKRSHRATIKQTKENWSTQCSTDRQSVLIQTSARISLSLWWHLKLLYVEENNDLLSYNEINSVSVDKNGFHSVNRTQLWTMLFVICVHQCVSAWWWGSELPRNIPSLSFLVLRIIIRILPQKLHLSRWLS